MFMTNSDRRWEKWEKHSVIFLIFTYVPFSIHDSFLAGFERTFCEQCPWCGREYPFWAGKKLKKCCAERKEKFGPYPGLVGGRSSGYSGGPLTYDPLSDSFRDQSGTGRVYTRSDR